MIVVFILGVLYGAAAEELREEVQSTHCNYMQVLQSEETSTDFSPTFPTTSFTCWGRYDGYYADVEVDCTIFHYCQTWQFPTGLNETVKWDFACPQSTIFNQKLLSCTPPSLSFDCQESPNYYWVNYNLTSTTTTTSPSPSTEFTTPVPQFGQQLIVGGIGPHSATLPDSEHSPAAITFPEPAQFVTSPDSAQPVVFPGSTQAPILYSAQPSTHSNPAQSPNFGVSGFGQPPGEVANESEAIKFP